ncbi:MAG TPA: ATPase, T2SS/T4P/T4SS family, partial [Dongiaceae bacterium]|nr:ATPase, T2SS/T4P/T4SS family [Dongiaceae bacterium]
MFGRRSSPPTQATPSPNVPVAPAANQAAPAAAPAPKKPGGGARPGELDSRLQEIKQNVFNDLISTVDLAELAKLDHKSVREAIGEVVAEIINLRNLTISAAEQQLLVTDICNDVLGLGPLEPLIARDDIADIMVNGPDKVYIECNGKIELTDIKFRDQQQLMNICQRIVSAVGRRVDEASPICDARLMDGSRVNVIAPPLALDGAALTIRKFKRDRLTLEKLMNFGSVSPAGAKLLQIIGHCRLNTIVSGGTGSGKTTLLNCLTQFIDRGERVITCEDAA